MAKQIDPQRRERILSITLKLFSEKGYYGVSVGDIAKECEISRGSLYTYFKSKQELVNTLYQNWKGVLGEYVGRGLNESQGREKHKTLWRNLVDFACDHPIALGFLESQHHASYLTDDSIKIENDLRDFGVELYKEFRGDNKRRDEDIQILMSVSYGAYIQLAKEAKKTRISFCDKSVRLIEESVWRAITIDLEEI